jgi:hypothetical protein
MENNLKEELELEFGNPFLKKRKRDAELGIKRLLNYGELYSFSTYKNVRNGLDLEVIVYSTTPTVNIIRIYFNEDGFEFITQAVNNVKVSSTEEVELLVKMVLAEDNIEY